MAKLDMYNLVERNKGVEWQSLEAAVHMSGWELHECFLIGRVNFV
jgi:hypothetical protein